VGAQADLWGGPDVKQQHAFYFWRRMLYALEPALSVDTLGLHLEEAKHLLQKVQAVLIDEQVRTCRADRVACPDCGRPRAHKDTRTIVTRTLFGTQHLRSPR
jgi:hypothetical protein